MMRVFLAVFGSMIAAGSFWNAQRDVGVSFVYPTVACLLWAVAVAWLWKRVDAKITAEVARDGKESHDQV